MFTKNIRIVLFAALILYLGLNLFFHSEALAQKKGKVIVISNKVGKIIDPIERNRYQLFQEIQGFLSAEFCQLSDSTFEAKITYVENNTEKTTLQKLSASEIEVIRESIGTFKEIQDPGKVIRKNQPMAFAIHVGYYAPSLSKVNEFIGEGEGTDFPSAPCFGCRVIVSKIPRVLFLADYYHWISWVEGETDFYQAKLRLKVQSVSVTGLYKIKNDLFSVGLGCGIYFADFEDDGDIEEPHFKNNSLGLHLSAGIFEGPNNKLFNFSLEGRYIIATIGETNDGFPKTQLSGPMVILSIIF